MTEQDKSFDIRPVTAADEGAWRVLWSDYLTFYEATLPISTSDLTWRRIVGNDEAFGGFVAVDRESGEVIGMANIILHPSSWSEDLFCLLNDLFVVPETRGRGIGKALIQHLIDLAPGSGWARVYWVTKENNTTARTLYDRFGPADGFIRYTVKV
jgi:GNAT superfamily N-acetyltransferase